MNAYEQRKQDRLDRHADRVDRLNSKSEEHWEKATSETRHIPLGQPILVGHHSEGKHRRALERAQNNARKAFELG